MELKALFLFYNFVCLANKWLFAADLADLAAKTRRVSKSGQYRANRGDWTVLYSVLREDSVVGHYWPSDATSAFQIASYPSLSLDWSCSADCFSSVHPPATWILTSQVIFGCARRATTASITAASQDAQ